MLLQMALFHYFLPHLLLFIHVDEHLGYFCVLAIVNSTAMNTGMHVSSRIRVFVFVSISF